MGLWDIEQSCSVSYSRSIIRERVTTFMQVSSLTGTCLLTDLQRAVEDVEHATQECRSAQDWRERALRSRNATLLAAIAAGYSAQQLAQVLDIRVRDAEVLIGANAMRLFLPGTRGNEVTEQVVPNRSPQNHRPRVGCR